MSMLRRWLGLPRVDLGIDLGTANTLVTVSGRGIVLREPSVVAIETASQTVRAVGYAAKEMIGRTPAGITAVRPLKDGVIADFDMTREMLVYFVRKSLGRRPLFSPRMVIGVPGGVTEVEKNAVEDGARAAGARDPHVIEEQMAAAIGAGLPVLEPVGSMIVDIGGGTTEVAVISLGGVVTAQSIRIAGDEMDESIIAFMRRTYNLLIGDRTAEEIKMTVGAAYPLDKDEVTQVRGRDLVTGLPGSVQVSSTEVREAISEDVRTIVDAVKSTFETTPPELAADIMQRGVYLAGGGALLRGIDRLISAETGLPVHIAEDPLTCVVVGAGRAVDDPAFTKLLTR